MLEPIESHQLKNGKINIYIDDLPMSPREWDNIGELYIANTINEMDLDIKWDDFTRESKFREYMEKKFDAIVLPVYKYEHSGIVYNTTGFSCPWDSGQCGYIIARKEVVRKEFGVKRVSKKLRERILKLLISEVETFSQWASGDVYGFEELDSEDDVINSCWGFYGNDFKNNGLYSEAGILKNNLIA